MPDALDLILQKRGLTRKPRAGNVATRSVFPPAMQQKVASLLAGYETSEPEEAPFTLRSEGELFPGARMLGDIAISPVRDTAEVISALPGALRALVEQPAAAARGFASGATEAAMSMASPVNLALLLAGKRGLGRGKTKAGKPGPTNVIHDITDEAIEEAVRSGGARVFKPGQIAGPQPVTKVTLPARAPKARPTLADVQELVKGGVKVYKPGQIAPPGTPLVKRGPVKGTETAAGKLDAAVETQRAGQPFDPRQQPILPTGASSAVQQGLQAGGVSELRATELLRKFGGRGEAGMSTPELLGRGALAAGGAAVGGALDEEDPAEGALIGAFAGLITPAVARTVARAASGGAKKLEQYYYFSLLSGTAPAKATLGAYFGASAAAAELAATGQGARAAAIARELRPDRFARNWLNALRDPAITVGEDLQKAGRATGVLGIPTRFILAADHAASTAMRAGGLSAEEAARYTLAGTPTSAASRHLLGFFENAPATKPLVPFPRVGVQFFERGLERSPHRMLTGKDALARVRGALGGAALAGGAAFGEDIPSEWLPFIVAAAGPYGLPVLAGTTGRKAVEAGNLPLQSIVAALQQQSPLPSFISPANIPAGLVPQAVASLARARDPYERETATPSKRDMPDVMQRQIESLMRQTKAKIPGLRETLPVRPSPVNVFGEELFDRGSAVKRFLTTTPRRNLDRSVESPAIAELERLGIPLEPPQFERKATIRGREIDVPTDVATRLRRERRSRYDEILTRTIQSERYQQLDDEAKRRVLARVLDRLESRASARSRRTIRREVATR